MAPPAPTYDLVLLLDAEADAQAHARILDEVREAIAAGGELLRDDAWGDRALTYQIAHKPTAKYHLLQFRAPTAELLQRLDRALRFADEVVRFRIVKLKPGTPEAPRAPAGGGPSEGAAVDRSKIGPQAPEAEEVTPAVEEAPPPAEPVAEAAQPA